MEIPTTQADQTGPSAESQTILQCIAYLQAKDDTARFVGLAMLASILKNVTDQKILRKCWEAMNYKFLDRLLKSGSSTKTTPDQAKDMVELAVNVIHAFSLLLIGAAENPSLTSRIPGLIAAIPTSSPETISTILETLSVFATGEKGAVALLATDNLDPLLEIAPQYDNGPQIFLYACVNALRSDSGTEPVSNVLSKILNHFSRILPTIGDKDPARLRLLSFFSELLSRLPPSLFPQSTEWVTNLYRGIRTIITSSHNEQLRTHIAIICASLLHSYPTSLLFQPSTPSLTSDTTKPFTFFFLRLILIDIRTTFPALMEQLSSPIYPHIAQRLSSDFDILAAFIDYLITIDSLEQISLDPDTLLKLRHEIGETFGLTIEFLRDRWDAAYAGAAGYDMDLSEDGKPRDPTRQLNLTWEAKHVEGGAPRDPLVISAVHALSLWLREDDSLRKEAGGLMDLFLGLWKQSKEPPPQTFGVTGGMVDYRPWLVGALEGAIAERNGREAFQSQGGWELLWSEIKSVYTSKKPHREEDENAVRLAVEEVRVLVEFVKSGEFMEIMYLDNKFLEVARTVKLSGLGGVWMALDVGLLQLAAALLKRLPGENRLRRSDEAEKVRSLTKQLGEYVHAAAEMGGPAAQSVEAQEEVVYVLAEIMEDLGLV